MKEATRGTVTIENLQPKMTVYNLAHPAHTRVRKIPQVQELKNGKSIGVFVKKRLPTSITFLARERKSCLPDTILQCPDIQAGLRSRRLRMITGAIVDRAPRAVTPVRPETKPAKQSKKQPAAPAASLTGPAKTDKD